MPVPRYKLDVSLSPQKKACSNSGFPSRDVEEVSADQCDPQKRTLSVMLQIALYLVLLSRVVAIPFSKLLKLGVDVGIDRRRDGIFIGFEA